MVSIYRWFLRFPYLLRLLFIVIIVILFFGTIIHYIEPDQFPTIFDGVWWAIITTSTIGYGDYVPGTIEGRLVAIILIFIGAGIVAAYFVALSSSTVKKQSAVGKGEMKVNWKDHFIIVGWNERTKEMIKCFKEIHPNQLIVLIDSNLKENPFTKESNILFVKGNAATDEVLLKANIKEASLILITSDPTRTELNADMNTILFIVAIKGVAPDIFCIAEILTSEQIINAKRAGADGIIESNKLISSVMQHAMYSPGISNALLDLVDLHSGARIQLVKEHAFAGQTFASVSQVFLEEEKILLGIKREDRTKMLPPLDTILQNSDELLIISRNNDQCE